jgi:23S rRNA U2552 (ribose-2'-O)-methylase RlmE/FtsJ
MLAVEHFVSRAPVREGTPEERPPSEAFTELAATKDEVERVRALIGAPEWSRIVNTPYATTGARSASRAYHKLKEILLSCALPNFEASVHLCEAPGGFVQAAAETAPSNWTWTALTLQGGHAPIPYATLPVEKGQFIYGDIFDPKATDSLPQDVCLVTADGAAEMDHSCLEEAHYPLLVAQTQVALRCLRPGGTLVIKFFEGGLTCTQRWIAWLSNLFIVSIIKPVASRPTNSERYLVGRDFKPVAIEFSNLVVAAAWTSDVGQIVDTLAQDQSQNLRNALARARRIVGGRAQSVADMVTGQRHVASGGCDRDRDDPPG